MSKVVEMKPIEWSGGFNDTAKIVFSRRQNEEKLLNVTRLLNDCWTIVKLLFNDCWTIVKRLLKDC